MRLYNLPLDLHDYLRDSIVVFVASTQRGASIPPQRFRAVKNERAAIAAQNTARAECWFRKVTLR